MSLSEGTKAPDIQLNDENGKPFTLSSLAGKTVVLYFYPKAGTGGCTLESTEFRELSADFSAKGAVIVGISPDREADQLKVKTDLDLPFSLLADSDHAVAEAYGVWKEKFKDGQSYMGVDRTTFVINSEGMIQQIFHTVNPDGHAEEVLAVV
jgi:peroxiredoxin Q/BCP